MSLHLSPHVPQEIEIPRVAKRVRAGGGEASPQVLTADGAPFFVKRVTDRTSNGRLIRRTIESTFCQFFALASHNGDNTHA